VSLLLNFEIAVCEYDLPFCVDTRHILQKMSNNSYNFPNLNRMCVCVYYCNNCIIASFWNLQLILCDELEMWKESVWKAIFQDTSTNPRGTVEAHDESRL
jgi:hypothetical protein